MNLVSLLSELKVLLAEPEGNLSQIVALLERHQALAEYEVARFYVARFLGSATDKRTRSVDPRERLQLAQLIPVTFPRAPAAKHLRRLVKDPDPRVRASARHAVRKLGLADVALPDTRFPPPRFLRPLAPGAWNPSGWAFGIYRRSAKRKGPQGLPPITHVEELLGLIGLRDESQLAALMRPGAGTGSPYVDFEVPKASGGVRRISAPRDTLKRVQRAILDNILSHAPVHGAAHGFVPERSTVTNAQPHTGARVVVRIDLSDFFPSIHYRRVAGFFRAQGYPLQVANILAGLTTHRPVLPDGTVVWPGALPQGAPTSPALANLVCRRLDARLSALAAKAGARYTRYADDLTFSFQEEPARLGHFLWWVDQICQQEGFAENPGKRRVMRRAGPQRVTGLVVNSGVHLSRAQRRQFRAILHNCKKEGLESQARGRENFAAWLEGFAAYANMVQPELGARWMEEVRALKGKK